jgi:hypothetical protein
LKLQAQQVVSISVQTTPYGIGAKRMIVKKVIAASVAFPLSCEKNPKLPQKLNEAFQAYSGWVLMFNGKSRQTLRLVLIAQTGKTIQLPRHRCDWR